LFRFYACVKILYIGPKASKTSGVCIGDREGGENETGEGAVITNFVKGGN
jgi:hypothetical protein